jgi:hypothetical protein
LQFRDVMRPHVRGLRFLVLFVAVASLTACHLLGDHFFEVNGQVVECESRKPIPGVTIDLLDDQADGAVVEMASYTTDAHGRFSVETALYRPYDWLTVRFSKTSFQTRQLRVEGGGDQPGEVCLVDAPAP